MTVTRTLAAQNLARAADARATYVSECQRLGVDPNTAVDHALCCWIDARKDEFYATGGSAAEANRIVFEGVKDEFSQALHDSVQDELHGR